MDLRIEVGRLRQRVGEMEGAAGEMEEALGAALARIRVLEEEKEGLVGALGRSMEELMAVEQEVEVQARRVCSLERMLGDVLGAVVESDGRLEAWHSQLLAATVEAHSALHRRVRGVLENGVYGGRARMLLPDPGGLAQELAGGGGSGSGGGRGEGRGRGRRREREGGRGRRKGWEDPSLTENELAQAEARVWALEARFRDMGGGGR